MGVAGYLRSSFLAFFGTLALVVGSLAVATALQAALLLREDSPSGPEQSSTWEDCFTGITPTHPLAKLKCNLGAFPNDVTGLGTVLPLDRWLQYRFLVRWDGTAADLGGKPHFCVNIQAYSGITNSSLPTQAVTTFPQPGRFFFSPNETNTVSTFLDEIHGYIRNRTTPGVETRNLDFAFAVDQRQSCATAAPVSASVTRTATITTLDAIEPYSYSDVCSNSTFPGICTATVRGTVVASSGSPVANANLSLDTGSGGGLTLNTASGADGSFSFPPVPPHPLWGLSADKSNHGHAWKDNVAPTPGIHTHTITLTASSGITVTAQETATATTGIGFWRGRVDAQERYVLLTNGQENWRQCTSCDATKASSKLYLYTITGTLVWAHDMGWEAWGAALSDDASLAAYVKEKPYGPGRDIAVLNTNVPTGTSPSILWSKYYSDLPPAYSTTGDAFESKEVEFSHDGRGLAMGSHNGSFLVFTTTTGAVAWWGFCEGQVRDLLWSADDTLLYAGCGDGRAHKYNAATGAPLWSTPPRIEAWPFTYGFVLSPDEQYLAVETKNGFLTIVETLSGTVRWSKALEAPGGWAAFSPDGQYVAAGGGGAQSISLFRVSDGTQLWRNPAMSQAGRFCASGGFLMAQTDPVLRFYDINGATLAMLNTSINGGTQFAHLTNDCSRYVASGRDLNNSEAISLTTSISFGTVVTGSTGPTLTNRAFIPVALRSHPGGW